MKEGRERENWEKREVKREKEEERARRGSGADQGEEGRWESVVKKGRRR